MWADMAWHRVTKPSDVVTAGDSIEVKVLKITPEGKRISLGLKQLAPIRGLLRRSAFTLAIVCKARCRGWLISAHSWSCCRAWMA